MEEYWREDLVRDVVCLNDAAGTPYLPDLTVINAPLVLLICSCNDVHALDEAGQTRQICRLSQVLDETGLVRNIQLRWQKAAVHDFVGCFSIAAVGGSEAEGVCDVEREGRDVELDCFGIGPDAGAFFAGNVLDDLVEDFGDDGGKLFLI